MCHAKPINLSISAISAYEQRKILEVASRHRHPKRVVMSLDYNSFSTAPDKSLEGITPPPLYLYDDNRWNDFRYLINSSLLARSIATIRRASNERYSSDTNRAWNWEQEVQFGRSYTVANLEPGNIRKNLIFNIGVLTIPVMRANFEANIATVIAAHPETEFNLLFPPYSILVWVDYAQRNQLDVTLDFKHYVTTRLANYPNVRLYDFQWDAAITHDLDRYKDIYHYDPAVNRMMMQEICTESPRYRLTEKTLPQFIERLRTQSLAADPYQFISKK